MPATLIAVDLAQSVFEVAVSTQPGRIAARRRLTRAQFARFVATQAPATVRMEACGTAHFWGRQAQAHGHRVVRLPAHAVRPYVTRNKTDRADAKGLLEAARNETIHPVPVKSAAHQALTALHRLRSAWLAARTARLNTVRGVLREFGITIPLGARRVSPAVAAPLAEADTGVPVALRPALQSAVEEIGTLERRVRELERQIAALADATPAVAALRTVPGIGLLSAPALVAFVTDATRFPTGRHFASYLGLTPREHSSGRRRRLGAISKRGDPYLRMLPSTALALQRTRGHNPAAVGLANKLARIAWAVWTRGEEFTHTPARASTLTLTPT
jgi:transposase